MTFGAGDEINFLDWLRHPQAALPDERALVGGYIRNYDLAQASSSFAQREAICAEARLHREWPVLEALSELWDAYASECHMSHFRAHRTA